MAKGQTILELIVSALTLIKSGGEGSKRRTIRQAFKSYRKIRKLMRKSDGISAIEQGELDKLMYTIMKAQDNLLKP